MYADRYYKTILTTFFKYLPSRLLVVLNSFIIVPVLAGILSVKEVGLFQLLLGVLNFVCTCSTDWIAKSVLRFYEKYKLSGRLDEFFSNTLFIFLLVYFVILLLYFVFGQYLAAKFSIPVNMLFIVLIMVIPVGFRQFLYQMLRIFNKPFVYTLSIAVFQISMLVLFLTFTGFLQNVYALLFAMSIAIILIDLYLLYNLSIRIKFSFCINFYIIAESLKYALPQILTNCSVWAILNCHKFVAQADGLFDLTAVIGLGNMFISGILMPIFSLFIFALFPIFIRKYEKNSDVKFFLTNSIKLYSLIFLPITLIFCFYASDISGIFFADKFLNIEFIIAFYSIGIFFHEMMKLFNIKYHLRNKMYIEMGISVFVGLLCILFSVNLIPRFGVMGAGLSLLVSLFLLIILNYFVKFNDKNYVDYFAVMKTLLLSLAVCCMSYFITCMLFLPQNGVLFSILKIAIYVFCYYMLAGLLFRKILE